MTTDISASYLGLRLRSPIVVGSSPMTLNPETVRELEIAGAGAIVLPSLFEEQIVHDLLQRGEHARSAEMQIESLNYEQKEDEYNGGPQAYLDSIAKLKALSSMPVIASLNGCTDGRWLTYATQVQEAGADALEIAVESAMLSPSLSADEVEQRMIDCISDLCDQTTIPVSVKLSPFHTNLPNLAWRLIEAGASGFVCFAHDTNWRVSTENVFASLNWPLTSPGDINQTVAGLIRVRCGGPSISVAASGGIASADDICKLVIAGADVAMITSEIHRSGPSIVANLIDGIANYLRGHRFDSFEQFIRARPTPRTFLRSEYLHCLTQARRSDASTPATHRQEGDRWGHLL